MDQQEIPALVIRRSLCVGCKKTFNKLKKDILEIQSIEFDTEHDKVTIFGAVDPAEVLEKLRKGGIEAKILLEESSPIYQEKQIVLPKASVPKIHDHVEVVPDGPAGVHFVDFPSESAGIRIQDEPIVKKTPDCYLNHEHKLVEVKGSNKRFICNGCRQDGFNLRYRCEPCDFDLHHECKSPEPTISPEFAEKSVFKFHRQPPKERRSCDACGMGIYGCFYNCNAKGMGMNLHPCCAKLKVKVSSDDMVLVLGKKATSECLWCQKKKPPGNERRIPGWCYASNCKKYNIHIQCITQMLHEAWQMGLTDGSGETSIQATGFQHMSVSDGKRRRRAAELALKIIGILKIIVGILLGDPSVLLGSVVVQLLDQLLKN